MDLNDLIFKAGEAETPPAPPEKGIPKQKIPHLIRRPFQWLLLPFIHLDLAMQKLARFLIPPPYKQGGSCKQRGNCCHYILIRKPKGPFGFLFKWWNTEINGFYLRDKETYSYENKQVLVMGCRYLQKDGKCSNYRFRPMVCRKWPAIQQFGHPRILKGCGYTAIPKQKRPSHTD